MDFNEEFEYGGFTLDIPQIAKYGRAMAITRLTAANLINNPYMTVADFMNGLNDSDLESLVKGVDNPDQHYEDYILLALMLSQAEGCEPTQTDEEVSQRMDMLVTFLCVESLGRKGLCKVYRENMSFHPDMRDKNIAEKLDD